MTFAIGKNKYDINQIQEFEDYVFSFYGAEDALYQMNVTKDDITLATEDYLEAIAELDSDLFTWGDGDSLDRERVRDMLVRNYVPPASSIAYPCWPNGWNSTTGNAFAVDLMPSTPRECYPEPSGPTLAARRREHS